MIGRVTGAFWCAYGSAPSCHSFLRQLFSLLIPVLAVLLASAPAMAQVQRSFINLGFEAPNIPDSPCRLYITDTQVPGWTTSHPIGTVEANGDCGGIVLTPTSGRLIELWNGPRQGVTAREGTQFAELNAVVASRISQSVCLLPNEEIEWHFSHRGRASTTVADQTEFLIGSQQIVRVATTSDGDGRIVNTTLGTATMAAGGNGWVDYGGTFIYPGVGGQTNIGFGAVSSAGGSATEGNFIDRIDVILKPFVDFAASSFSTLEGSATNLPALRIVGTVPAGGMNVRVTITGGTATLGSDYATPGNATTFSVFVPGGDYGSGGSVALPVSAILDAVTPEPDETVLLQLAPATAADDYVINSTRTCPGDPIINTTWTIRDAAPALQLVKTAVVTDTAPPGPSAGDIIRYSFAVTNTGNTPLTNVTVSDALPGIVFATPSRSIPTLAVGATDSTTFANYASYTVTAADIAAGSVTNNATASGTAGITPITSNPSSVTTPLTQTPGLSLLKTAVYDDGNRGYAQVGDPIAYTFRVTNTGNVPITGITVSDSMLPPSLRPIVCPNLNPGASANCTHNNTSPITYAVTQANIEAGFVTNTATASGGSSAGTVTSNPSSTNTTLVQAARLALVKTAGIPSAQAAGGTIAYTFRVTNTGNVPVNTLSIVDPQLVGPAVCPAGSLAVGATVTCTGTHVITQAEMDAGQSVNSAQARALTTSGVAVVSPPATTTTRLQAVRSISVDKRVIRSSISTPTTLVYTIVVTNTGTASFNTLTGTDVFPDGTSAAITNRISQAGGDTDNIFEPGEVWTYQVSFVVTQAMINAGGTLTNRATFAAQVAAETPVTATDAAVTTILQSPSLTLVKSVDQPSVTTAPTPLNYTITLTNTGNIPLTGITATDTLTRNAPPVTSTLPLTGPGSSDVGADGVLGLGEAWTYTAQYIVTQTDLDYAGDVVNTVTVDTAQTTPRTAQVRTALTPTGALRLVKSVSTSSISEPGPLTYTIVLYNDGTSDLFNIVVSDTLPDGTAATIPAPVSNLGGPAGADTELQVGEYWTYTIPFTVTDALFQQALAAGTPLVNSVVATADTLAGDTITAPVATAETEVNGIPALHIEKTVNPVNTSATGPIVYTVTVENTGNQNLTGVVLTDAVTGGDPGNKPVRPAIPAPTGDGGVPNVLEVGETWTYNLVYNVTQLDLDSDTDLLNTATVTTTQTPTPATATAETTIEVNPGLRVDKAVDQDTVTTAGTVLNYTIDVQNIGNVDLTGLTLVDTMPDGSVVNIPATTPASGDTGGDGIFGPGETWRFGPIQHTVTQDEIDQAALTSHALVNTIVADTNQTDPVTDTVTTTVLAAPSVTLRKTVDVGGTSTPGPLNYTITVANTGEVRITGVALTDTLQRAAGNINLAVTGPSGDTGADLVLGLGETWTYQAQYVATQEDIDFGQPIVNSVVLTTDQTPDQTSQATTTVTSTARMFTLKYPDVSALSGPGVINYTIALYNLGSSTLSNVALNDILPDGTPLTPDPAPVSNFTTDGNPANDALGLNATLDPNEYWTYTVPFTVTEALFQQALASPERQIVNTVTPTATAPSGNIGAPRALGVSSVLAQPAMALEKQVDRNAIGGPARLTYTIALTNTGNQNLTGVSVSDSLDGGALAGPTPLAIGAPAESATANGILEVGETWTYTVIYDATALDVASGNDLVNTVTATSAETPAPLTASATTDMLPLPALDIGKSVDRTIIGAPGPLTYTIAVTNIGNIPQTGISLVDRLNDSVDLSGAITGPLDDAGTPGVLDLGETWTYSLTYDVTQADIEAGPEIVNVVSATSDQVTTPVTASVTTFVTYFYGLDITKTGRIVDDGDGFAGPGDTIEYSFVVTNSGNVTLNDVTPRDPGPSFNGVAGAGTMSAITPAPAPLGAGESRTFTATYTPAESDYDNAAGLTDAVVNSADAVGFHASGIVVSSPSTAALTLPGQASDVSFIKQALVDTIRRGEVAPFAIIIENRGNATLGPSVVTDLMPPGFVYVEGSATVDGVPVSVAVEGRRITFAGITVPAGGRMTIGLSMRALPSTPPGTYVNGATVVDPAGAPDAPPAEAEITIVPEAVFDCSEVIGKVFNDLDRDGYQDEGEPGLPGARLATVRGTLITTDEFGRYSIPCAALPNQEIGSNFVLKLDTRTLPSGFALTTDNPAMIRLTAGKMSEINFGVSIGRQVRIDLDAAAFMPGSAEPGRDLAAALDQLIPVLLEEQASLTLTYDADGGDRLGSARLQRLEALIRERWTGARGPYDLVIDLRIMENGE